MQTAGKITSNHMNCSTLTKVNIMNQNELPYSDNIEPLGVEEGGALRHFKIKNHLDKKKNEDDIRKKTLRDAIFTAEQGKTKKRITREPILGTFFKEGGLGFIHGTRGVGKTLFGMKMARCIAEGGKFGPWEVHKQRKVLYVDGEMDEADLLSRDKGFSHGVDENLYYLTHEEYFNKAKNFLNFTDETMQNDILEFCEEMKIDVIFLDNLSCLFRGMHENEADDWEKVLPWIIRLRQKKIALVVIVHSNRGGKHMRGTSRREDAASFIIRLDEVKNTLLESSGKDSEHECNLIANFTKNRLGTKRETASHEFKFETNDDKIGYSCKEVSGLDLFIQHVKEGLESCSDIAQEIGMSKGQISKLAKKAEEMDLLIIEGQGNARRYKLR